MPLPVAYQNQFKSVHVRGYWLPEELPLRAVILDKSPAHDRGPISCNISGSSDLTSEDSNLDIKNGSSIVSCALAEDDILSTGEITTLSAISSPSMHHQKSWSFILTRMVLGEVLQQDPKSLKIDRVEKPSLSDRVLQFNVSHSANLWIIAWSFDHEVGIDVQKIDTSINYQAIMRQFFTKSEQAHVNTISDFFDIWTRKEAALKLQGLGFVYMPKIVTNSAEFISLDISPEFKAHLAI